jgi:hypothetical protein
MVIDCPGVIVLPPDQNDRAAFEPRRGDAELAYGRQQFPLFQGQHVQALRARPAAPVWAA